MKVKQNELLLDREMIIYVLLWGYLQLEFSETSSNLKKNIIADRRIGMYSGVW